MLFSQWKTFAGIDQTSSAVSRKYPKKKRKRVSMAAAAISRSGNTDAEQDRQQSPPNAFQRTLPPPERRADPRQKSKREWLYLGRASPDTTPELIREYVLRKFAIDDILCFPLQRADNQEPKSQRFLAFKIGVNQEHFETLRKGKWIRGVVVRPFKTQEPGNFRAALKRPQKL